MPYYNWKGITITGAQRSGYLCCPSQQLLDAYLFNQEIALLGAKDRSWLLFRYQINAQTRAQLFEQLTTLIRAGIRLPDALTLIATQHGNPQVQEILFACAHAVQSGILLSDVMQHYPKLFDPLSIQVITVGQEAGNLTYALELLAHYTMMRAQFYQKVRSALAMPLITLFFVIAVTLIIVLMIIPQFLHLFNSMQAQMPPLTKNLIRLSNFVSSKNMVYVLSALIIMAIIVRACLRIPSCKEYTDESVIRMPFFGRMMLALFQTHFFSSFSLLLQGNMQHAHAIAIIAPTIRNTYFKRVVQSIAQEVKNGKSLSTTLAEYPDIFSPDTRTMIHVAEESATLPKIITLIAAQASQKTNRLLNSAIMWLQPLLLLFLGLVIGVLIIAVYSPILQLSLTL